MFSSELKNLIFAVAEKDRAAFHELYHVTSGKLFSVAIRLIKRADLAEDILQDSYIKIWDKASEFTATNNSPMAWMVAIVRNRAIDILRKRGEVGFSDVDEYENIVDDAPDPLSQAEQNGDLSSVFQCLKGLDEEHKKIFLLAYYYGYTHEEIAKQFSVPVGTIKSRIRRSLARIRSCMCDG
ncbi:MAG: sigma-70 family RNA polymerase sigma factor [Methyloligellaceae bacterium]